MPASDALIVAAPMDKAVTWPEVTVARSGAPDVHVAFCVTSSVDRSENVAVAVSCDDRPAAIEVLSGVIARSMTTGSVTTMLTAATTPWNVADTRATPGWNVTT